MPRCLGFRRLRVWRRLHLFTRRWLLHLRRLVSGDAAEAPVDEEKTVEIATGVAEAHSGGGGAAVPGPRNGVAGGVLAAAGVELECDAAADGGVDAVRVAGKVKDTAGAAKGKVEDAAGSAKEKVEDAVDATKGKLEQAGDYLSEKADEAAPGVEPELPAVVVDETAPEMEEAPAVVGA
jgi:uncharacterized protein YjbJ (UPF0337 family)